jgi:hypothetical protein
MKDSSILSVLGFTLILSSLSACSSTTPIEPEKRVEVLEVPIENLAPIVPSIDILNLKDVEWFIITEDNYLEIIEKMKKSGVEPVIFGLTSEGYENLSLNTSDLRKIIQQQKTIIAIYEKSYSTK